MKKLDEIFNVQSSELTPPEVLSAPVSSAMIESNADYDYDKTRANLHNLINQGQEALVYALDVAKESESPRAFEVVGSLIKQLADVNHQLLDLTEKRRKLSKEEPAGENKTVNNAFFVGSTSELNKLLRDAMNGE